MPWVRDAMLLHAIHHVPYEGLGGIADWASARGFARSATWQHLGDPLPDVENLDLLVVMGGPQGVYEEDQHAWMRLEKDYIAQALALGKPVLGVCLGAQMLAEVLGAHVAPMGHREIGWFPLRRDPKSRELPWFPDLPEPLTALHWHGDRFDLPPGATRLWQSTACDQQGFAHGKALGLQFHLEMTRTGTEALADVSEHAPRPGESHVQATAEMLADPERFQASQRHLVRLLDAWWDAVS
jgi:GMP synthase-like glutamine amidotransferase